MDYQSTNNYAKESMDWQDRQKGLNKSQKGLMNLYNFGKVGGNIINTQKKYNNAIELAKLMKDNAGAQKLLKDKFNYSPEVINKIANSPMTTGKEGNGLINYFSNAFSPSSASKEITGFGTDIASLNPSELTDLGIEGMDTLLAPSEMGAGGAFSSMLSNPYGLGLMALLGIGIGAGNKNTTMQKLFNPSGGLDMNSGRY
tara:strand:- start:227 stop:826 length:600 start_codon:yes stop_codon:yes gene_type:complete